MRHAAKRHPLRLAFLPFILLLSCVAGPLAHAGEVLYTYTTGTEGGLARLVTCDQTGAVLSHDRLVQDARLSAAQKLALDPQSRIVIVANSAERDAGVMLIPLPDTAGTGIAPSTFVPLPSMPDAVIAHGGFAYVGCDNGSIVSIDLRAGRVAGTFNARDSLSPAGQKPESFALVPSRGVLLASFQKDHAGGKRMGNRVIVLDTTSLALVADVQLPRTKPELHHASNRKEQGPGPEVVLVDEAGGRVLVTIDLYGAVIITELDTLLAGSVGTEPYHSVASDGSFGSTFPDRGRLVPCSASTTPDTGRGCALISNSGVTGGLVLFDLDRVERVAFAEMAPGLELSEPLKDGRVFAAHAGKIKVRGKDEVEKRYEPRAFLTEIRLLGESIELTDYDAPGATHDLIRADAEGRVLIVVTGDERRSLTVFDTSARRFLPERTMEGFGTIQRLIGP